jgi:hypothetical protein
MRNTILAVFIAVSVAGCAVRQPDLDVWVGMPVEALDTHSLFITFPMYKFEYTALRIDEWNALTLENKTGLQLCSSELVMDFA